jgi:hypothetical protein
MTRKPPSPRQLRIAEELQALGGPASATSKYELNPAAVAPESFRGGGYSYLLKSSAPFLSA